MTESQTSSSPAADPAGGPRAPAAARLAGALERVVDRIGWWISWSALAMVLVVATNVILRYLFRVGPVSMQELEWHLMSPIAMVGMSYAMRHGDHVRVDIFYEKFSPRFRLWIDFAAALATLVIAVVIIELSLGFVAQSYEAGEVSPDPGGLPYRFLLKSFIPFGFFLVMLEAAAQTVRLALRLFGGRRDG